MALDLTDSKRRQVFDRIDCLCEQRMRAITLRSHHLRVSDRMVRALKHLADLQGVKTPEALLSSMQAFQSVTSMATELQTNGGAESEGDDFRYLEGLYIIKASAISQILFIDILAQLYTKTQYYMDYWKHEEENPVHYAVTNIFWRFKQLHFLITNEAASNRRQPHTPLVPSLPPGSPLAHSSTFQSGSLLSNLGRQLAGCRPWEWPWRRNLTKWGRALSNPIQFQYLLRQCFSDVVRGNIHLLREVQRQVIEQLGHTFYLLSNLTTPDTHRAIANVTNASIVNVHEYLLRAQLSLAVVASQPTTFSGFEVPQGKRVLSVEEDLTITPGEAEQEAGMPLLMEVVQRTIDYRQSTLDVFEKVRPPRSRWWAHVVGGAWLTYRAVRWARHTSLTWTYVLDIVTSNVRAYFLDPVQEIFDTVFRSQAIPNLGEDVSASEFQALENMVTQYYHDKGSPLGDADRQRVRAELTRGDLGELNADYEACVRRPITSSLFGDMARLLLIQMQMQKVNITQLYIAMDDVMRKNELNFNVMAAMPATMLVLFGMYLYWTTRHFRATPVFREIRSGLRSTEVIFNRASGPSLHWFDQGLLLLEVAKMKALCPKLLNAELRRWFEEDLQEIEDAGLTCQQRLHTVQRMYRIYTFLKDEARR
eukprot:EG_transcript_5899